MTGPVFQLRVIPPGDPGAEETLVTMHQMVQQALREPVLVAEARRIVAVAPGDVDGAIERIEDVLRQRVRYVDDPPMLELLQTPDQLLRQLGTAGVVYGDCDDTAIVAATLGGAMGIPWRFRAVGFDPDGPLVHVYTLLRGARAWVSMDTTRNRAQATPVPVRVLEVE